MRKIALLFTLLLTLQSFAQKIGAKAGISFARYNAVSRSFNSQYYTQVNSVSFKPGVILGGYADFRLKKNLFLRPGTEFVLKGGSEDLTYYAPGTADIWKSNINFVAFDFPVNLVYKPGNGGDHGLIFGGGLIPGILIEGGLNKYDMGAGLLVGYELPVGLNVNLTYNHGLLNVATNSTSYQTLKNRSAGITVGYQFRKRTAAERDKVNPLEQVPVTTERLAETAQRPVKAFYAELGGPAGFLTFNIDTRLTKSHSGWGLRFGVGTVLNQDGFGFTAPVALNCLFGQKTHYFEVAGGASFYFLESNSSDRWFDFDDKDKFLAPFIWAGYRFQPPYKKFVFRAGFGQFVGLRTPGIFRIPSLSFGYSVW